VSSSVWGLIFSVRYFIGSPNETAMTQGKSRATRETNPALRSSQRRNRPCFRSSTRFTRKLDSLCGPDVGDDRRGGEGGSAWPHTRCNFLARSPAIRAGRRTTRLASAEDKTPATGGGGGEERSSSYVKCCNPAIRLRSDKASGANGFISFRDKLSGSFAARGPRQTYARPR